ncbi:AAA family ATPase [Clostridium sp. CS001]|uniref:AAA family ATPase n=1 Tax=Clostridium sp. CS001 TaxID=2880648 RepID=UPI001CF269A5|nr:ATP-binding protein [Clostridium sp. CS001]MCB2291854.1 AAA family ATPase [Clostridium sp. CS001]
MKVKSLYINKYKDLKDFNIDFNDDVNIIIGENGVGKTTILEIIYNLIISNTSFTSEDSEFNQCRLGIQLHTDELNYVNSTNANLKEPTFNEIDEIIINSVGENKKLNIDKTEQFYSKSTIFRKKVFRKVIYLPTDVNFKKYKVETPKKIENHNEIGVILDSNEMSVSLKEYLVNNHYKDLEDISIGEKPYRIEKFKDLYNSFFDEKEFLGVKNFEPTFKIKASGEVHSADELSAGEKQIFFRGGSLLQLNLENSIILIDEPELSLHPEWQQKILKFYRNIGKNNQIIIATHSPHIVSDCKREEVRVLFKENGRVAVKEDVEETYGWTVEQLLLSVFELKSVRNPEIQNKLDEFKQLFVNKDKLNNDELDLMNVLRNELEKYLNPEDPSLSLVNLEENSNKLESLLNKLKNTRVSKEVGISNSSDNTKGLVRNNNA